VSLRIGSSKGCALSHHPPSRPCLRRMYGMTALLPWIAPRPDDREPSTHQAVERSAAECGVKRLQSLRAHSI